MIHVTLSDRSVGAEARFGHAPRIFAIKMTKMNVPGFCTAFLTFLVIIIVTFSFAFN